MTIIFFLLTSIFTNNYAIINTDFESVITIDREFGIQKAKPLFLGIIGSYDEHFAVLLQRIKELLEKSGQLMIVEDYVNLPTTKSEITSLFNKNYDIALYITNLPGQALELRLYDVGQGTMLLGKKCKNYGLTSHEWARVIADDIWRVLMGEQSPFLTKIAFIKKPQKSARKLWQLCVSDWDGELCSPLFSSRVACVTPSWNMKSNVPFLFYSEFTSRNVRLMATDLEGHKRTVLDLDGTLVGIGSSQYQENFIYCRSGVIWEYHYDAEAKKSMHKALIEHKKPCASPSLCSNGDIIYCCAGKIYYYNHTTQQKICITPDGYCVAPAFCEKNNKIIYSKRVKSSMQLCSYDLHTKLHEQLTFDQGDKIDACWSPCGTYVAFCYTHAGTNRIGVLHTRTKKYWFITSTDVQCSYPTWSTVF